ncbi:MAG: hypothetical protein EP343_05035 [Deltaproteobacteria bacterium]|nr:MAG: hypothetical protein EP343_05035 [Deltaproteobacteria bacterium]
MNKKLLLSILLSTLGLMVLVQGCTSPTCQDYMDSMAVCRDKIVSEYGSKVVIEEKDGSKRTRTCKKETGRKDCGLAAYCVKGQASAFATCYQPGSLYKRYQTLVDDLSLSCGPIFAVRQAGKKSYYQCVKAANCDLRKINACQTLLKKEKKSGSSGYIMGFLIFLGLSILLEGLVLFGFLKFTDRMNPKVTLTRALVLSVIVGVISFPAVYFNFLVGMGLSASLLFGLIIIFFYQGAGMPTLVTTIHLIWVSMFFNFMVANQSLGNTSWLYAPKKLRVQVMYHHEKLNTLMEEFDTAQKEAAAARARLKKEKEEAAKKKQQEAKEKKKKEEAKDDDDD